LTVYRWTYLYKLFELKCACCHLLEAATVRAKLLAIADSNRHT